VARILLAGFGTEAAASLATLLEARRHTVEVCGGIAQSCRLIEQANTAIDLIILEVSLYRTPSFMLAIKSIKSHLGCFSLPIVLCVSTIFRGAQFEIELERQGARLVYLS
jgi:hypothetical protein